MAVDGTGVGAPVGASSQILANLTIITAGFTYALTWVIGLFASLLAWWAATEYITSKLVFPVLPPSLIWLVQYFQIPYGIGVVLGAISFGAVVRRLIK